LQQHGHNEGVTVAGPLEAEMAGRRLDPGTLWPALCGRTDRALQSGALRPLATWSELVEDAGVPFVVRVLDSIQHKRAAGRVQRGNPFLPHDEAMFVADVTDTHVALLNKFNVIRHHLLIVTRRFEDQEEPLTLEDFEALWTCMAGFDGLGFYNGGEAAGASQPHKHLQLVPLPFSDDVSGVPIEPLLAGAGEAPGPVAGLPFRHAVARIDSLAGKRVGDAVPVLLDLYVKMMEALGASGRPYNLLVTRGWMMFVPRVREHFESVSVNALGFAGSLFVRNERELRLVKRAGPMQVLCDVGDGR
jgi:ATP adenylyltransferase